MIREVTRNRTGPVDPNHLGSEVGEHHSAIRSGADASQFDDSDSFEGSHGREARAEDGRRSKLGCNLMLVERRGPDLSGREVYDILRLRVDVFVVEQNCPYHEVDGRDLDIDSVHLWLVDDDGIAAYLRVLGEAVGRRIGRVVTRPSARNRGLSSQLMLEALSRYGDEQLTLDAQAHLQGFYRQFGFDPHGAEFIEDGIPHVKMTRLPKPRS